VTQVRVGRKERRKQQAAFGKQRYESSYRQFLDTAGRKTDIDTLLAGVIASGGDLTTLVSDMHGRIYAEGIAEADYGRRLFAPTLNDIRSLPAAILDAKEELPPRDLIPTDREALEAFLRGLMIRNGADNNIDVIVSGWAEKLAPKKALDLHIHALMTLRDQDQQLYTALVGGRFALVIRRLWNLTSKDPASVPKLRNLLVVQALIWCAHDVQMVGARLTKTPSFGYLVPGSSQSMAPERALNQMRARRTALEAALDLYFGSGDWRFGESACVPNGMNLSLTKHADPLIRMIAKRIRNSPDMLEHCGESFDLPHLMRQVAGRLREDDALMARTATPQTRGVGARAFATEWYGLPLLAALAVAIRRLIQAEQQLPAMVDAMVAGNVLPTPLRAYDGERQVHGSVSRLQELLEFYRQTLFGYEGGGLDTASRPWKAARESRDFLAERRKRELKNHHGAATDPRRPFYLLDVIPEHRFSIG
jgi:hypothetical protein